MHQKVMAMNSEAQKIADKLEMQAHPEGGYYKETYRSAEIVPQSALGSSFDGDRNCCTGIYFLLTSETFSAFHRIKQDEMWHFYQGSPLMLHIISPEGEYSCVKIGSDVLDGQHPQYTVPAGYWFGATVKEESAFSLVGCTVSPGFDFRDFELAERSRLTSLFPKHGSIIAALTRVYNLLLEDISKLVTKP